QPAPRTEQTVGLLEEGALVDGVADALPGPHDVERLVHEPGLTEILATERHTAFETAGLGEPSPPRSLAADDRDAPDTRGPVLRQPEVPTTHAAPGVEDAVP